jgi:disulfide bond formation protein DsbB
MQTILRPRIWNSIVVLLCASFLGYGLYVQHAEFLDPCPLCIFQRVAFMWIGAMALLAAIHGPGKTGSWVYTILLALGGMAGTAIAGRHVWLQSLPPDKVPECGMGLNYMIETMPFGEVLREVFYGSGECAKIDWTFLGFSMPWWTLLWYLLLTIMTLYVTVRAWSGERNRTGR